MNELDALANNDFTTREEKRRSANWNSSEQALAEGYSPTHRGHFHLLGEIHWFWRLLTFYAGRNETCDLEFENAFSSMGWKGNHVLWLYVMIDANQELINRIDHGDMVRGVTIAAGGFFRTSGTRITHSSCRPTKIKRLKTLRTKVTK